MFTTVIAFLSGISAGVGPVRDFSLLCAIGIFTSFILSILFYTSLRYILDSNSEGNLTEVKGSELVDKAISKVSEIVDKYPSAIISTVIILTLVAAFAGAKVDTSFSLDDFLSDDLEVMVTADNIQTDFRGASYSQSQILIEGPVATTDFLNNSYAFQYGEQGVANKGLNDDRYVIKVGFVARVESVHEVIQGAVDSEKYNIGRGNDTTHEWIKTNIFKTNPGDTLAINWSVHSALMSSTTEGKIYWYDKNNDVLGSQNLDCNGINPNLSLCSETSVLVPSDSHRARIKFTHPKVQFSTKNPLISGISVETSSEYVYVQSLKDTFNLTSQGTLIFSKTQNSDIENLYDYLYQRDLDIADPFTGESYSDKIKHVLYRDNNGDYKSSVIRVYLGPSTNYELDNNGLEFMRSELSADIPSSWSSNEEYTVSITGGNVLTSVTVNEIQSTQISSTLVSIVLAAIVLIFVYRSVELGLIATLPTILATVWIMATMWKIGITLNVLTVMVTALTVGLGIDYAIHIVERYREEREHKSERQAIESTIKLTGSAILISGLTTVCGFAVLFLSPMPLVRNFGIITAATIIYSVLIAIFVLPSLIWLSNRIKEWYSSQTSG
jgi:predicted RND superfamily exporter protein